MKSAMKNNAMLAAALALFALPGTLFSDVNGTAYARSFDISFPGYTESETLTNFPVLVRLSAARNDFKYAKCKLADGGDVRFFDADGTTVLPSEVDTWNPDGESLVWVRVPRLCEGTNIVCRYGNANPDPVTASDVWSEGYVGVWHLNGRASTLPSSTDGGLSFTRQSAFSDFVALGQDGVVGDAAEFDIVTEGDDAHKGYLTCTDSQMTLTGMKTMTIEMWINQREWIGGRRILYCKTGNDRAFDFLLNGTKSDGTQSISFYAGTTNTTEEVAQVDVGTYYYFTDDDVGRWRHIALVYDSVDALLSRAFADGKNVGNKTVQQDYVVLPTVSDIKLGNLGGGQAFPGSIDEVRISNVARSQTWVKATHATVNDEDFAICSVPNDWENYSRRFSIGFTNYTGETLTDFPVLVKLEKGSPTGFSYADCVKPNGEDLRFADEDGNLLASEVDTWDTNGVSTVWVKVPSLNSATTITAYYGCALAPAVDRKTVWSNGYLGVWHLKEPDLPLEDSGANELHFTRSSRTASKPTENDKYNTYGDAESVVGKSLRITPTTDKKGGVYAEDPEALIGGGSAMTVEIWAKTDGEETRQQTLFSKRQYDNPKKNIATIWYNGIATHRPVYNFAFVSGSTTNEMQNTGPELSLEAQHQWKYHVATFDMANTVHTNYLNGAVDSTKTQKMSSWGTQLATSDGLCLGNRPGPGNTDGFNGWLDELRISNVARSADWVGATYRTITDNAAFTTYGAVKDNNPNLATVVVFR